jgi:hypothetical protein
MVFLQGFRIEIPRSGIILCPGICRTSRDTYFDVATRNCLVNGTCDEPDCLLDTWPARRGQGYNRNPSTGEVPLVLEVQVSRYKDLEAFILCHR